MPNSKAKKPSFKKVIANLRKEMTEPRMTRSAQAEFKLRYAGTVKSGAKP